MGKDQSFNIIIVGVGGQGLITLLKIISEAAQLSGFDAKTSELHGLSQRGGSVEVHARISKTLRQAQGKVFSPLVRQGGADLIIALEYQEALRSCYYASNDKTVFLINDFSHPVLRGESVEKERVLEDIDGFSKEKIMIPASEICKKEVGKDVLAGVFLLSFASFKRLIPLEPSLILRGIEKIIPEKFLKINRKTFNLAEKYDK